MTIKQMVLDVLTGHTNGMIALDILSEINTGFDKSYIRSSLSPQLSRLRHQGLIHKSGKRWILGKDKYEEVKM